MKNYRVIKPFPLGNTHHGDGVILSLSDKQAAFLLTECKIVPVEAPQATDPIAATTEAETEASTEKKAKK